MSDLKKMISGIAEKIEENVDRLLLTFRKRLNADEPLQIVTYRSYGTQNHIYLKGRVLKDKGIRQATGRDTTLTNLLNMYKRFETDEVAGATVKATFQQETHFMITDHEGYFHIELATGKPLPVNEIWHELELELTGAPYSFSPGVKSTARILIPGPDAEYGIISDLDDTVIRTTATSLLAMARNTFLHNAHSRLPFAGVSEFYKALQRGRNGKRNNPFFYVSSSPWNLYDLLTDFLELNDIPKGPVLLRDVGLEPGKDNGDHMGHKYTEIRNILLTYPHLNFVLIGDSGQDDPKIYRRIVAEFPQRILAIYIRDVQLADREKIAVAVSKELGSDNVEMIILDNTIEAANHATNNGLILAGSVPQIVVDKKMDKGELPGKENVLES